MVCGRFGSFFGLAIFFANNYTVHVHDITSFGNAENVHRLSLLPTFHYNFDFVKDIMVRILGKESKLSFHSYSSIIAYFGKKSNSILRFLAKNGVAKDVDMGYNGGIK